MLLLFSALWFKTFHLFCSEASCHNSPAKQVANLTLFLAWEMCGKGKLSEKRQRRWQRRSIGFATEASAVVLVSLSTGSVVSEFHQYCQPVEQPRLSPFCRQLTGISQDTVDDGIPLATCLVLFRQWLDSVIREHGLVFMGSSQDTGLDTEKANLVTSVTWSDWDLSVCLESECRRKQIRKPDCFNSWIDIRAVYRSFYNRRPHGLNNAMR